MANAYVTCIHSDIDLSGVLILAYSIFKIGSTVDFVCMVTSDVSTNARKRMLVLNIIVIEVDYIITKAYLDERPAMQRAVPNVSKYSTKWNCLKLIDYDMIIFIDLNMYIQNKPLDMLFQQVPPSIHLNITTPFNTTSATSILALKDGTSIPNEIINKVLYEKLGFIDGGIMVLKPDMKTYNDLLIYAENFDPRKFNTYLIDDVLLLASFYNSQNVLFNYLGVVWSCIKFKYNGMCSEDSAYLFNFIGIEKPWITDISDYIDTNKNWYKYYDEFIEEYPGLLPEKELKVHNYTILNYPLVSKPNEKARTERNEKLKNSNKKITTKKSTTKKITTKKSTTKKSTTKKSTSKKSTSKKSKTGGANKKKTSRKKISKKRTSKKRANNKYI